MHVSHHNCAQYQRRAAAKPSQDTKNNELSTVSCKPHHMVKARKKTAESMNTGFPPVFSELGANRTAAKA